MATNKEDMLTSIGQTLKGKYAKFTTDRQEAEQQWLKNLRQYRAKYDPEVESQLAKDALRSKVYPKDTHTKVVGWVAKMMEMMFPSTERNWSVEPTPFPNISEQDLNQIIAGLTQQKVMAAQAQMDPNNPEPQPAVEPEPVTSEEIELAVREFAKARAERMGQEIQDQLADIGGPKVDYPQLCKKVLRSGAIYGFGVAKGPLVRTQKERVWEPTGPAGQYVGVEKATRKPYFEFVKVWNLFPDMTAQNWRDQEGIFERMIMNRNQVLALATRSDFMAKPIKEFLKEHNQGNYTTKDFENELNALNKVTNVAKRDTKKYEIVRWFGYLSAEELRGGGVGGIKDDELGMDILADVWFADNKVIKFDRAPFGENPADGYHVFIYEDDEDSGLTGTGLPEVLRDSQMKLCAIDRATMDNMAATAGPITEINRALLAPGQDLNSIHAFKTLIRDDDNMSSVNAPAIRSIQIQSHLPDLLALRAKVVEVFDAESNLPSWLMGNAQPLGEAFRTTTNMSQMSGGANMVSKDHVRSFDRFVTSFIGALVEWNMEFNTKPDIKGDFQVQAKGTTSLVAKEVRGAALDQFWMTTSPEERVMLNEYKVLAERMKSRDLPTDALKPEDEAIQALEALRASQAAANAAEGDLTKAKTQKTMADAQRTQVVAATMGEKTKAQIDEIYARIEEMMGRTKDSKDRVQLEHIKTLMENLKEEGNAGPGARTAGGAVSEPQLAGGPGNDGTAYPAAGAV